MNSKNCLCEYCSKDDKWQKVVGSTRVSSKATPRTDRARTAGGSRVGAGRVRVQLMGMGKNSVGIST